MSGRQVLGVAIPPVKYLGPLLVVWAAMLFLFVIQDIGSSLMFFGGFLALLYVATNRLLFPVVGLAVLVRGLGAVPGAAHDPAPRGGWRHPFGPALRRARRQLPGRAVALLAGRRRAFGKGFGRRRSRSRGPAGHPLPLLPAAQTDLIYAVIVNELGLVGAAAVICVYLLVVERGFKTATLAGDSFSKLLAAGLTSVFALQVFVIVGGVTKLIPLTGVTLPFVSYAARRSSRTSSCWRCC